MPQQEPYDVVIVGGGVTGTATLYMLAAYTNVRRMALVEKYSDVAQVNSNSRNNSQTLHFGDIETNYTLKKALPLQAAGEAIKQYVEHRGGEGYLYRKTHKMVLAVGTAEVAELEQRFRDFLPHYPGIVRLEREDIAKLEPKLVEGRDPKEPLLALASSDGYAVNYQRLSQAFLEDALDSGKQIDISFDTAVQTITKTADGQGYNIQTPRGMMHAKVVLVASGPYSLLFAQALGYGKDLAVLPVAGSFYFSDKVLDNKVYTMQDPDLPFAATHGDPDVVHPDETRFGPTAKVIPMLERHRLKTVFDFLHTPIATLSGVITLLRLARNTKLRNFLLKNLFYDAPIIGKILFLRSVRKIIPSMQYGKLHYGRNLGGIRPQVVNLKTKELQMGESKIVGDRIIFVTTPSPGASVCLKNAEIDARAIVKFLGDKYLFDEKRFREDFGSPLTP